MSDRKRKGRGRPRKAPRKQKPNKSFRQMPLPIGGFPKRKLVKLRYVQEAQINAGLGTVAYHTISANGIYDPDTTGVGHQPMNFDTWMTLYDHYVVLGSKIKVEQVADTNTPSISIPAYFGILKSDSGSRSGTMAPYQLLEQRGFRRGAIPATSVYKQSRANGLPAVQATYSAKKWFGLTKRAVLANDKLQGTNAKNPDDGSFYEICCASVNLNNPDAFNFLITVDYTVMLSEPKPGVYS